MRLFGLIGYPLSHSFSKKYFSEKFEKNGLVDCRYELFPIRSIHELSQLLRDNPGLEGLNVTIPYKKQVLSLLNSSEIPEGLEACNCISIKNGNLVGYNTDAIGFEKSLLPYLTPYHTNALILGSGGATEAIVYVLKRLRIKYSIVSREKKTGSAFTYEELNEDLTKQHKLIINTTPLGMYPATNTCPAIPYNHISSQHLLFDLTYNPSKTLFLQKGEERGATIKNGQEMLLIQAEESWKIWNKNSTK